MIFIKLNLYKYSILNLAGFYINANFYDVFIFPTYLAICSICLIITFNWIIWYGDIETFKSGPGMFLITIGRLSSVTTLQHYDTTTLRHYDTDTAVLRKI